MSVKEVRISEGDLAKSLRDLEAPPENKGTQTEEVRERVVVTPLRKSTSQALADGASPELKKALEVSTVLNEAVGLMGLHLDTSLEVMHKSIRASAERDRAMIKVLTDLKKSLDDNTEAIKKFGEKPGAAAGASRVTTTVEKVLQKSVAADGSQANLTDAEKAKVNKARVLAGISILHKSASNPEEQNRWVKAAAKFESTGNLPDIDLAMALNAVKETTRTANA